MSGHVCSDQVFPAEEFIHHHSFVRVRGRAVTFVFPSWEWRMKFLHFPNIKLHFFQEKVKDGTFTAPVL